MIKVYFFCQYDIKSQSHSINDLYDIRSSFYIVTLLISRLKYVRRNGLLSSLIDRTKVLLISFYDLEQMNLFSYQNIFYLVSLPTCSICINRHLII